MKNIDKEQALLSEIPLGELIEKKIAAEIQEEVKKNKLKIEAVSDFSALNRKEVFSKYTLWTVFNRNSKCQSILNGIQVESLLGLDVATRTRLLNREIDCFLTDEYYVKFLRG